MAALQSVAVYHLVGAATASHHHIGTVVMRHPMRMGKLNSVVPINRWFMIDN